MPYNKKVVSEVEQVWQKHILLLVVHLFLQFLLIFTCGAEISHFLNSFCLSATLQYFQV